MVFPRAVLSRQVASLKVLVNLEHWEGLWGVMAINGKVQRGIHQAHLVGKFGLKE